MAAPDGAAPNGHLPHLPAGAAGGDGALPPDPFAPGSRRPWYRRPILLGIAALVVVAGAAVLADLPTHATTADHAATIATEVQAINTDVHPCTYAVTEAFSLYRQKAAGQLNANQRAQVPGLLRDDQTACSFTDQSVVNLGTLTLPQTSAGQHLSGVVKGVLEWETSDGVAAIDDIQSLVVQPHDAAAKADLAKQERLLAADRADVHRAMSSVNAALGGAHIPPPSLPNLPTPATRSRGGSTATSTATSTTAPTPG